MTQAEAELELGAPESLGPGGETLAPGQRAFPPERSAQARQAQGNRQTYSQVTAA